VLSVVSRDFRARKKMIFIRIGGFHYASCAAFRASVGECLFSRHDAIMIRIAVAKHFYVSRVIGDAPLLECELSVMVRIAAVEDVVDEISIDLVEREFAVMIGIDLREAIRWFRRGSRAAAEDEAECDARYRGQECLFYNHVDARISKLAGTAY
jgi:hypothetical protein